MPAGPSVGFIRAGLGSVWKMEDSGVLLQIDPRTRHVTDSIAVGVNPGDVAIGAGAVWITDKNSQTLLRISPQYGEITRIPLPAQGLSSPDVGGGVAVGAGSVWVAEGLSRIVRIDPASGRVESTVSVPDAREVAFGDGAIWVGASDTGVLTKVDPRTGAVVATARIGPWICCIAVGGGYVWAASDTGIWKLASDGRVLGTISVPSQTANIYLGAGALWVATDVAGTVLRIDPRTDRARRYRIGHLLTGIGVQGSMVVVSVHPTGSDLLAHLSGPVLEVRNSRWFVNTDPATAAAPGTPNQPWEQQLQYATCEPLLGYPDAPAPAGWQLVPEAVAWPAVSPDGRTFTFKITDELAFDTKHGLFADPRMRQAVNYALDRPALAAALGDLVGGNYLPPGLPGSLARHVYPLSGPDLARARALAGPHGGHAVLAVCSDPGCTELGQIIQADLARIGIRIQLRPYAGAIGSATTRSGADIVLAQAVAPYPDPAAFLKTALGGGFGQDSLAKLAGLDRDQRVSAASQLELQLMRGPAPLAAIGTPVIPEFFSVRVRCHVFQPLEFGADLGSLCLG